MSLKTRLYQEVKGALEPVSGGKLEILANEWGYKPSTAGRRLRDLAEADLIEPQYKNGCVYYTLPKKQLTLI
jgi:hypothetical protein